MKFLLIFLLYSGLAFCQTLHVTYTQKIDMSGDLVTPFYHTYELVHINGMSVQKRFLVESLPQQFINKDGKRGRLFGAKSDTSYVFKDFLKNEMYTQERLITNYFDVKDKVSLFKWEILNDTATVLSFPCKKARTVFRGRTYEVYYTDDIPVSDGPAKFNGLPGLILKVKMIEQKAIYEIEAVSLSTKKESVVLINPYQDRKTLSFEDYRKYYLRKYSEIEAYSQTTDGLKVHRGGVEVIE